MKIDWEPLRDIIEANERFVLTSHVRPDADAIGSELAMAAMLEASGKSVRIVNPSAIPANLRFLDPAGRILKIGQSISAEEIADTDVHIVLDTSAWVQLLDVGKVLRSTKATKVVIDHHASSDDLGAHEFKDTTAEATGALICRMADALGYPLTEEMAVPLYCALATDTGWYRFSSTTSQTMKFAGRLIDLGARPNLIFEQLYEQKTSACVRLAGCVLGRVTVDFDGKLAYTWVKLSDFSDTGAVPADTENLINECLTIAGTQCAFIAIEQSNKKIKVSFRSRSDINVAAIAEQFGGGGHKQAAGAILPGILAMAKKEVLSAFEAVLSS